MNSLALQAALENSAVFPANINDVIRAPEPLLYRRACCGAFFSAAIPQIRRKVSRRDKEKLAWWMLKLMRSTCPGGGAHRPRRIALWKARIVMDVGNKSQIRGAPRGRAGFISERDGR